MGGGGSLEVTWTAINHERDTCARLHGCELELLHRPRHAHQNTPQAQPGQVQTETDVDL